MSNENLSTLRAQVDALRDQIKVEKQARDAKEAEANADVSRERLERERDVLKSELASILGKPVEEVQMPEVVLQEPTENAPAPAEDTPAEHG